jgi:DNA-3-methyladenine glycosylase
LNEVLGISFYDRKSMIVAEDLIGKTLVRILPDGQELEGNIVETEAYGGSRDPASHAFRGISKRNEVMFGRPGRAYIYFTYGFYYCLNIVSNPGKTKASAVLIRAIEPVKGIEFMEKQRKTNFLTSLTSGPGKLCQALSIDGKLNGTDVTTSSGPLYVVNKGVSPIFVRRSRRVGITTAIDRKWRFFSDGNPFVSKVSFKLRRVLQRES